MSGSDIASLLETMNEIPQAERARLIQNTTPRLSDAMSGSEIVRCLRETYRSSHPEEANIRPATTIETTRDDIRQNPRQLLDTLMEKFTNKEFVSNLQINFIGEAGLDSGGLSRQFISDLFSGLAEKLSFKEYHNGLLRPELEPGKTLDPADEQTYKNIGRLLMFCLNASDSYPIGMIFDAGVYSAIQAFSDELLKQKFSLLESKDFDKVLSIYEKLNEYDESTKKSVATMKRYLEPWNERTSDGLIETVYELIESDLPKELQGLSDIAMMRGHADSIQNTLKKYYMNELFAPALAPIHAIACGMKDAEFQSPNSWEKVKTMDTGNLEETVQGVVTIEKILEKLVFREVSDDKQEWVKNWIKNCDEKTLKRFLYMLTGSNSLGRKDLVFGNTSGGGVIFHTCFNVLDFPFSNVHGEQEFKGIIEAALTGKAGYNIA
jgi:hypothetical protein